MVRNKKRKLHKPSLVLIEAEHCRDLIRQDKEARAAGIKPYPYCPSAKKRYRVST